MGALHDNRLTPKAPRLALGVLCGAGNALRSQTWLSWSACVTYQQDSKTGAFVFDHRSLVRQCITKGAFAELRAACVRQGGPLTSEFLDLEREIDSFASPQPYADLGEQLTLIEKMATKLRQKAAERI